MKNRLFLSIFVTIIASLPIHSQPLLHRQSIHVQLLSDHITVTEVRDITPGGTEECYVSLDGKYLTKKALMKISDITGKNFEQKDFWNTKWPSSEKQEKCARMWTDDRHARIYWGLFPGVRKTYFITYPLLKVLYTDGNHDVLDYDFVNLKGQTPADSVEIKLYLAENKKINESDIDLSSCKCDGEISLIDGALFVRPKSGSRSTATLPIHITFRQGLFSGLPTRQSLSDDSDGLTFASSSSTSFIIPEEELHSPLMGENTPRTENADTAFWEYVCDYPKTSIFILCILVIAFAFAFRKIKAMTL